MKRSLPDKIVAVAQALDRVPHAFGGALALAYYAEPRATIDIDLNVFVAATKAERVRLALAPVGGVMSDDEIAVAERDGQVRVDFDGTPLDLFFSYDDFHEAAFGGRRQVPFAESQIWVLSASHLAVCKAVFARPKDWVDLDAMVAMGAPIDAAEVMRWVGRIVGDTDRRYRRIAAVLMHRGAN